MADVVVVVKSAFWLRNLLLIDSPCKSPCGVVMKFSTVSRNVSTVLFLLCCV